jgi:VWFA-related protein
MVHRSGKSFTLVLSLFGAALLAACFASAWGAGQGPETRVSIEPRTSPGAKGAPTRLASLRLDLKIVLVPVTVTDPLERPVTTLPAERFRLLEDGVEQKIAFFSQEDGPVSLGFLFDSSGSMKNRIASSVEALEQFFLTSIPGDEYFLIQFSDQARLLNGFTPEPKDIKGSLRGVQARGWTALLDAVALASHQMRLAKNPSKALLILSDGNDNNSRFSESEIRSRVLEADVRIYAVGILHSPRLLQQLAEETGGKVLVAQDLTELPDISQKISADIRSQYVLGYASGSTNDGKYHRLKVELTPSPGPQLRTSWRHGYFSPAE